MSKLETKYISDKLTPLIDQFADSRTKSAPEREELYGALNKEWQAFAQKYNARHKRVKVNKNAFNSRVFHLLRLEKLLELEPMYTSRVIHKLTPRLVEELIQDTEATRLFKLCQLANETATEVE